MKEINQTVNSAANRKKVRWIAQTGILTAAAVILMYLEMSLPLMPAFLKFDFSEVVVLIAACSMGPLTGIIVELLKNLLHLPVTHTAGVGELANFVIGAAFVGTVVFLYKKQKTRRGTFLGMAAGTLSMTLLASLINYFIMIPFYVKMMDLPLPVIIDWVHQAGNTLVSDLKTLIVFVFIPFNLFKGALVSLIVALIYKRISPLLH